MDKKSHTEDCKDETVPHLPMGQLFYLLHSNGFNVKPEDYIEMIKVTERFGSVNIDETAKWICPIIATSETEQLKFYNIIEQYKKIESAQACERPVRERKFPRWFKIALFVFFLVFLSLTICLSLQKNVYRLEESNKQRTIKKGQPLFLDASTLLKDHPADSSQIQFIWLFSDGTKQAGLQVYHTFNIPGDYLVKRQFYSRSIPLPKKSDSLLVHVCNDLPKVNIKVPEVAVMIKKPVAISANVEASAGTVSGYQWTINDSVFTTSLPVVNDFIFSKEGDYTVECKAIVGTPSSPCSVADNAIIHVEDNETHYSAHFSSPRAGSYAGIELKWWVSPILLLLAAAGLCYSFIKRKKNVTAGHENKPGLNINPRGPFDIPFEQNDTKFIQPEIELRHFFTQMKYKAEEETLALNINGTIQSIIKSGGSPQLVFAPITQQQQYLLLIDRANPKSMLTRFFRYLAKSMAEEGMPVVVFYYDKNFMCFNDQFPGGLSLQRVADSWRHATLIILGKAHELVYNVYPVIEENFLKELNRWQSKAVITPVPIKDWAVKEKILQDYIILLPADVAALQKLLPALREKIKFSKSILEITEQDQYSLANTDFRDVNDLKNYLGKDNVLFQWLCAICIYPKLKWEVFVEIGKAVLDKYGQPESLNYSNLLKLCRISWMQQGVFPQATRLELLKLLKTENEICAREKLLHMLNYSTVIYGGSGHFFEEEKRRQILTNQFVLHASDNNLYNQYAGSKEAFRKLWENDSILDMPVKKYLDRKDNDNWQTPVTNGTNSVGLSTYFNLREITLDKTLKDQKILTAIAAVLLIGLWIFLAFAGGAEKFDSLVSLGQVKVPEIVSIEMKVIKNFRHCGDSLRKNFDQLEGYLEISNQKFPLLYNQKFSTASFDVPYENLITGAGKIMFNWGANKSIVTQLNFNKAHLPDSVTINCFDANRIKKPGLYIRYNDTSGYRNMEAGLTNALYEYSLSPLQADFTDSSRIVYYERNEKARADSIVEIIKQTFNIHVTEEFIAEERIPPAPPMLFLNTSGPPDSIDYKSIVGADKESGDGYHRMGDESFYNKQYQEAIAAYKRAVGSNPLDALAFYQMGICYELLGSNYNEDAIEQYTSAIGINAKDVQSLYRRASVLYELKKYAAAIQDFNRVIAINSSAFKKQYISSLELRGKSNLLLNNVSSACEDFKKAADAGSPSGKTDYGSYCEMGTGQPQPIPKITAAQLSGMLLEVSTGKKTATDFIIYLRANDIAVIFNGKTMAFTEMCKALKNMKAIKNITAVPTTNERNQITAMTVTTNTGQPTKTSEKY
ncbi:MAG: tetratricopeptide repeat protein [Bacteroidota bacterium]